MPQAGRWPVWRGARRRATWAAATGSSAGPWVRVPHLASHLLGRMARVLSADWQRLYAHPIHWLETFVDPQRFRGTCYRAANWISLGMTTGRGKDDREHKANRPIKEVLGYPLVEDFRERLSRLPAPPAPPATPKLELQLGPLLVGQLRLSLEPEPA